jgi:hypothetical protein
LLLSPFLDKDIWLQQILIKNTVASSQLHKRAPTPNHPPHCTRQTAPMPKSPSAIAPGLFTKLSDSFSGP